VDEHGHELEGEEESNNFIHPNNFTEEQYEELKKLLPNNVCKVRGCYNHHVNPHNLNVVDLENRIREARLRGDLLEARRIEEEYEAAIAAADLEIYSVDYNVHAYENLCNYHRNRGNTLNE